MERDSIGWVIKGMVSGGAYRVYIGHIERAYKRDMSYFRRKNEGKLSWQLDNKLFWQLTWQQRGIINAWLRTFTSCLRNYTMNFQRLTGWTELLRNWWFRKIISAYIYLVKISLLQKKRPFICTRILESYRTEHQLKGRCCPVAMLYMLPLNGRVKRETFTDFRGFVEIWWQFFSLYRRKQCQR